jgi:conjugal transfer pilus assembly protein TraD
MRLEAVQAVQGEQFGVWGGFGGDRMAAVTVAVAAASGGPVLPIVHIAELVTTAGLLAVAGGIIGILAVAAMRWRGLAWSWGLPLALGVPIAAALGWKPCTCYAAMSFVTGVGGFALHCRDLKAGGDLASRARARRGIADAVRGRRSLRQIRRARWITDGGMVGGIDQRGRPVEIPICGDRPANGLTLGATGSGKTIFLLLAALAAIARGLGVLVVDPKGDDYMLEQLGREARRTGRLLLVWDPAGGSVYNPYEHGSDTEIADKLLAGETFTEPHYLRLAQRHLGHVVRALRGAGMQLSLARVVDYMQASRLASLARDLPAPSTTALLDYLESMSAQQERDLAGAVNRLATLADSDLGRWLEPETSTAAIDLRTALEHGDVVVFRLEADRRPLAAPMLAGAIVQDLVAICAARQSGEHRPGLVIIDEFSGVAAREVVRLFSRARGANLSIVLGTQEAADLSSVQRNGGVPGAGILDQVLGNIEVLVAHRQNVPESAELVAAIAGTRGAWVTTEQTGGGYGGFRTGLGSRTRGREYAVHPDEIKCLDVGEAVVIVPRRRLAKVARIIHPSEISKRDASADRARP